MTNKITVPSELIHRAIDAIEQVGYQDKFIDYTFVRAVKQELRAALTDPVPPAGVEPDGYKYRIKTRNNRAWTYAKDKPENFTEEFDVVPLYSGDIVTRLQAEVERLKAACSKEFESVEVLSHELTKARECLNTLQSAVFLMIDNSGDADDPGDITIMRHDFDKLCELVPEDWQGLDSNQSAPADKGQGEPVCSCPSGDGSLRHPCMIHHEHEWDINDQGTATVCSVCGVRSSDEQPAPVAVSLPERKTVKAGLLSESNTHNQGWNACLDELARLNSEPKP